MPSIMPRLSALPGVLGLLVAISAGSPATAAPAPAARPSAALTAIEQQLRSGQYERVRRAADAMSRKRGGGSRPVALAARAEMALGLLAEARRRLEQALVVSPEDLLLRAELTKVVFALGDRGAVKDLAQRSFDDWEDGRVDRQDPRQLTALAVIVRHDDNWEDANAALRAAMKLDRKAVEPNLVWGALLLDKHAIADAEACFREVLALDPRNPEALVGRARVMLERGYDGKAAEKDLSAALSVNPRHADALTLRGSIALDGEDWPAVKAAIAALRKTNPEDPGAAWLAAGLALLRDQSGGFQSERDRRLEVRAADGDFFLQVAEALVRHRRYDQAREVAADGVDRDGGHPRLLASLGNTLLRLGEEKEGVALLRRAFDRDPYDVRTYNLLNLFEKVIPPRYVTVSTANLRFRVEQSHRPVIESIVGPFLEETFRRYVERYGFRPAGPVMFELYSATEHYAVRTVGLPRLGLAGVCFGKVITSQSPANGAFNWGMVLAHELAHVFSLQLSRSRVPRWFTEGLAERETARLRPDWQRQMDLELLAALEAGALAPMGSLSQSFVRAANDSAAAMAYMHSAAAVDFLERRFGFARLRAGLEGWGKGQTDAQVLEQMAGMPLAELETAFRGELRQRLATSAGERSATRPFLPASTARYGLPLTAEESEPRTSTGWAERGLRQLAAGDREGGAASLARARRHGATDDPLVVFLDGWLALEQNRPEEARQKLEQLQRRGLDSYDVQLRLALAALAGRDADRALRHLKAAVKLAPGSVEARALLAEHLASLELEEERLAVETEIMRLEPQTATLAKRVVLNHARAGRSALVADLAAAAIFIDPDDPDLHAARGRALLALGKTQDAVRSLELALSFKPEEPRALHRALMGAYEKLGETRKAAYHRSQAVGAD